MRDIEANMKHDFCLCEVVTEDADGASVDMQEYKEVAFPRDRHPCSHHGAAVVVKL